MIVDHLCYGVSGGAAGAAIRIHQNLLRDGVHSRFWHSPKVPGTDAVANCLPVRWPDSDESFVNRIGVSVRRAAADRWTKFRHYRNRPAGQEYFSTGNMRRTTRFPRSQIDGDVLFLHWLGKLLDYESFFSTIPSGRPVVWVMHDMNPFTGGCHFNNGCHRFEVGCGHCPLISAGHANDITAQTSRLKVRLFSDIDLHAVAPSTWLAKESSRSAAMSIASSCHVIPYGIDAEIFRPEDQRAARKALNLPLDQTIVAFGADSVDNVRKGFRFLQEMWPRLDRHATMGIMFGGGQIDTQDSAAKIQSFGFIRDQDVLRTIYNAADVFVLPSLEDNLPQTGLESMACGTPVVAFDTGGIPDYVQHGATGRLAELGSSDSLFEHLSWLLNNAAERREMGVAARQLIEREFSQQQEVQRYRELLTSLFADGGRA